MGKIKDRLKFYMFDTPIFLMVYTFITITFLILDIYENIYPKSKY